jgi:hypothetical protein
MSRVDTLYAIIGKVKADKSGLPGQLLRGRGGKDL